MVGRICNIRPEDVAMVGSGELLAGLRLGSLGLVLGERGLHWFGCVGHSGGAVRAACDVRIEGGARVGMEEAVWEKLP